MEEKDHVLFSVRLDPRMQAKLAHIAKHYNTSKAGAVRRLIQEEIDRMIQKDDDDIKFMKMVQSEQL